MCGIVGILDVREKREIDRDLLHRMNESQHHRGPDEGGLYIEPGIGLGHRRLSIIDLSSGQQPLFNEDKSVVVVYNGEIYNFQALAAELKDKGHVFRTHCDTEVIVHAWEEWGRNCVERFRGMFVFAVWDKNKQELLLARDRLGIKPLYYSFLQNGQLIFGSEFKSLLMHPGLKREIDPRAVDDYFGFGYIPEPKTIFSGALKLSPGHTLHIKRGRNVPEPEQYWDVPFQQFVIADERAAAEELIERLQEAVRIRLVAEVPLGAFLSGGVDSSAVVAMMARLNPGEPVNTCSIGFDVAKYNETEYAQLVADRYATNHRVECVDPDDFSLIDRLGSLYDEPFADSSAMPTYRVCQLAKKQVTVALSGDGGDENLAGYRRYRWHVYEDRIRSLVPDALRKPLFGTAARLYPKADWAPKWLRAKSTLESISRDNLEGYFHSVSIFGDSLRRQLFSKAFTKQLQGYQAVEVLREHARRAPVDDPLSLVQYLDLKTYLVGDILTKVDRASMAHSLEVRVPILDHLLVEWMSGLRPDYKLREKEGKYLLKKGLESYLPNEVLYRPKMGFGVPLDRWFKGPLKERVRSKLLAGALGDTGIFDEKFIKKTIDQHQSGVREGSAAIWSLLVFEAFIRQQMQ